MIRAVGVVVPVNDEWELLPSCLDAILAARAHVHESVSRRIAVRIVLVLDRCTDGSGDIAAAAQDVEVVRVDARNVGMARRTGAAHVLAKSPASSTSLWLANTDADSAVPVSWLTAMIEEADKGADLVLGTVTPAAGLPPSQQRLWHSLHRPYEGHPHVHGTNFGIRADVYQRLGGWPTISSGEDRRLADLAARAGDVRVARTPRIPVRTSVRLRARAPVGFSTYLRSMRATGRCCRPARDEA